MCVCVFFFIRIPLIAALDVHVSSMEKFDVSYVAFLGRSIIAISNPVSSAVMASPKLTSVLQIRTLH